VTVDAGGAGDYIASRCQNMQDKRNLPKGESNWDTAMETACWTGVGLVEDLVACAVSPLNMCRTTVLSTNVCTRVLFQWTIKKNY
jgi:hypothetical protein